jgi:hypothetical protein
MHDQHLAAREMRAQVLRPPLEPLDTPADEPLGEALGKREAQVDTALLDAHQNAADEHRLEPVPHRFHLGEFRHEPILTAAMAPANRLD